MADNVNPMNYYQTIATNQNGKTDSGTAIKRDTRAMDEDAFVRILVAEMANQSPDNPQDSTQFVAQMAQFSSVQEMTNLNRTMTFNSASNTIGKFVTLKDVDENGVPIRGLVRKTARNGDNITVFVQLFDSEGNPVYQQKYDSNGKPVLDSNGKPVYVLDPKYNADGTQAKDDKGNLLYEPRGKVVQFSYSDISAINDGHDVQDTEAEAQQDADDEKKKEEAKQQATAIK